MVKSTLYQKCYFKSFVIQSPEPETKYLFIFPGHSYRYQLCFHMFLFFLMPLFQAALDKVVTKTKGNDKGSYTY